MDSITKRVLGFFVIGAMVLIQLPQRLLFPMKSIDAEEVMRSAENCSTQDCGIEKSSKNKEA
jgi:hypothetical protein